MLYIDLYNAFIFTYGILIHIWFSFNIILFLINLIKNCNLSIAYIFVFI